MEILGKLFGGAAKIKIMRLFLLNPEQGFEPKDIALRSKVSKGGVRSELSQLSSVKFILQRKFLKEELHTEKSKKKHKKPRRVSGWFLNPEFAYLPEITNLLVGAEFVNKEDLMRRFKRHGKIKLFVISGIFLSEPESRVDFLLVGDNFKRSSLETTIKKLESEIGKELSYAVFDTQEFLYRLDMYDKLVRDVLDSPHEALIESKEFSTLSLKKS